MSAAMMEGEEEQEALIAAGGVSPAADYPNKGVSAS
jgi:hypothetical protein